MNPLVSRATGLLLLGTAVLCSAHAAEYYVSPSGRDTNPGTLLQPWKTIQKAANSAVAGDTVLIRRGVYRELVTLNASGADGNPITFKNYPRENPILCASGKIPPDGDTAQILIQDQSNLVIEGLELRNYRTTDKNLVPAGIFISGECRNITLRNNRIHHIYNTHVNGNAFGIAVYGTSAAQAVTGLLIKGNDVHHLKTGTSESVVLNGNVDGFEVTANKIHDNNNIGLDFIGLEGTCPNPALDRARNGVCRDNRIWNISSRSNRSYAGEMSAGGIYCDGSKEITIERNVIWSCDIGVELASEAPGGTTSDITVRENFIYRCNVTGISLGGYEAGLGSTTGCQITHNSLFSNNTRRTGSGEIQFQHNVAGNTLSHNIIHAWTQGLLLGSQVPVGAGNLFSNNLYHTPLRNALPVWEWAGATIEGLPAWTAGGPLETGATLGNPLFVKTSTGNLRLKAGSPAIDTGNAAFVAGADETDIDGNARVSGAAVDRGAHEFVP